MPRGFQEVFNWLFLRSVRRLRLLFDDRLIVFWLLCSVLLIYTPTRRFEVFHFLVSERGNRDNMRDRGPFNNGFRRLFWRHILLCDLLNLSQGL